MSLEALSDFTIASRYAKYLPEQKRRETWEEAVGRVKMMHVRRFPSLREDIEQAFAFVYQKKVLPAMRSMQFGGRPIEKTNARLYNCTSTFIDRVRSFQEAFWLLLCGSGVGFSVQKHHIEKLPRFHDHLRYTGIDGGSRTKVNNWPRTHVIEDSIEGWANALGILLATYMPHPDYPTWEGSRVEFRYHKIRPKGSPLSNGMGKAPGPEPLKNALKKIRAVLDRCVSGEYERLRPIDAYDIIMHASDAVLSGGVRRSATICLFSLDDDEMVKAKTGNWFIDNPQRGRSNNSAVLMRDEVSWEQFKALIDSVREFGEPGFFWTSGEQTTNPCQAADATVLTREGIRTIGEIDAGDYIWSEQGWTRVTKKWCTGIKPVYRYRTTAGSFEGTENHRIVCDGVKVPVGEAEAIDTLVGPSRQSVPICPQDVLDGLVVGDGTVHKAGGGVFLMVGEDDHDYYSSSVSSLITQRGYGGDDRMIRTATSVIAEELPKTFERRVPERFLRGTPERVRGFLRGLYSANGSICGKRVTLKTASPGMRDDVQLMLSSLGIRSYFTTNRASHVQFDNGGYDCRESYDVNVSTDIDKFQSLIGFIQKYKCDKLSRLVEERKPSTRGPKETYQVVDVEYLGDKEVFDITVEQGLHTYWSGGLNVSNCVEIGLYPVEEETGETGWQKCNLVEINGKAVESRDDFYNAVRAATFISTLQATYTRFDYLGPTTEKIVEREALLGVSITGIMDSPSVLLNEDVQTKAAEIAKEVNREVAAKLGINPASRITCVKPAGTTSCVLGTASGIHPHHSRRYFRRVQENKDNAILKHFKQTNPQAVETSVWSANGTDEVVTFLIEASPEAKTKKEVSALELLQYVQLTQKNWVTNGKNLDLCVQPWLSHNVSNTINVRPDEWEAVARYIYDNREYFAGVSLLSDSGDLDYPQAPFQSVLSPEEIIEEYGVEPYRGYGLVLDAIDAFSDLWSASSCVLGIGETLPLDEGVLPPTIAKKHDWCERTRNMSKVYFDGDLKRTTHFLKCVWAWDKWSRLKASYKDVDYTTLVEEEDATTFVAEAACAGGSCAL